MEPEIVKLRILHYTMMGCITGLTIGVILFGRFEIDKEIVKFKNKEFDESQLVDEITRLKLRHKSVIIAQARYESRHYSSNIWKENHNLFGMKISTTRPSTAVKVNRGHASYLNWKQSVLDYAFWQASFARKLSKKKYLRYLKDNYAESAYPVIEEIIKDVEQDYPNLR
jgi:hypothetical protein